MSTTDVQFVPTSGAVKQIRYQVSWRIASTAALAAELSTIITGFWQATRDSAEVALGQP